MIKMRINKQSGFTLIEALVALVIFSLVFSAVWGWFNTAVISSEKVSHQLAMPSLYDEFNDYLTTISLENTREGEFNSSGYSFIWVASPLKHSKDEVNIRQPQWALVLFNIEVNVYHQQKHLQTWQTQHLDYWRLPQLPSPFSQQTN